MNRLLFQTALAATALQAWALCSPLHAAGEAGSDFVSLFDGETLTGWVGATENYEVSGGVLSSKEGVYGGIFTEQPYADFCFRFEFRLTAGANNGVALRAPLEGDPAYVAMESQILDNTAEQYAGLEPYQFHGSIYGVAPAARGTLKPVGEWNSQEICCLGRRVRVTLNGAVIVDVDLDEVATDGKTIDGKQHPGLQRSEGRLGLLAHADRVDFRNLRVLEIHEDSAPESVAAEHAEHEGGSNE